MKGSNKKIDIAKPTVPGKSGYKGPKEAKPIVKGVRTPPKSSQ